MLTHKEIKHNVSNDNVECAKVHQGAYEVSTVCLPIIGSGCTIWWLYHAVMHYFVPIFPGNYSEQHGYPCNWRLEIGTPEITK